MNGLRIDLVSEHASPLAPLGGADAGGQNVHVAALARGLADLGCEVTVLTRSDAAALPPRVRLAPGVTVEHVVAGPRAPLPKDDLFEHMPAFAAHLRRRWAASPPDLVHAHFWMSGWAAAQAAEALAEPPPLALTFHALGSVKRRHQGAADTSPRARLAVEAGLVHRVGQVIATCSDERAELAALGCPATRVTVIPCGVDVAAFRPDGPALTRDGAAHRLVTIGRLVPRKGVDDVIRALPALPGTELLVAGGPPAADLEHDPEATRLRDLARRLGVGDRVRLLGALDRAAVPPLLRSADAVVCVPWYEPFGIVPLEAMACGVPVIGSAVGGLLDSVDDGRTGALVPPRDPAALAAAARALLGDPDRRRRLGRAGVARVRHRYTWPLVARTTLGAYRALVAGTPTWAVPA
jgi:D-inositol-3-phosphate glycosyltransferase